MHNYFDLKSKIYNSNYSLPKLISENCIDSNLLSF